MYTTNTALVPALDAQDHVQGNAQAAVSLIEYGDYECPACGLWNPLLIQLVAERGTGIAYAFREYPLVQIHQNAMISAQAAEAANLQGKFWQMHDLLYAKQQEWENAPTADIITLYFDGYAKSLGLDVARFDADIASDAVKARVQRDIATGDAARLDHTPTFFINGKQINNPSSYVELIADLDAAAASSTQR